MDREVVNNNTNDYNGHFITSDAPFALVLYSLNINETVPIFSIPTVNSNFSFNSYNRVGNTLITSTSFGQNLTEKVVYTLENSNRIIGLTSLESGVVKNETTITYTGNNISKIVYAIAEYGLDNYNYSFTDFGNTVTHTEIGSTLSTEFVLDSNDRPIRKESFNNTTAIKTEVLDYDVLGNCIVSIVTGENASYSTFVFDTNNSPLIEAVSDQFLLN